MQLDKRQKVLLIVLAVVVAFGVVDFVVNSDDYSAFYGDDTSQAVKPKKVKQTATVQKTGYNPPESAKSWGRDPFADANRPVKRRSTVKRAPKINLILKAISYAGNTSVAMINDQVLSVGDQISGYKVTQIDQNQVVLVKDGTETVTLKL